MKKKHDEVLAAFEALMKVLAANSGLSSPASVDPQDLKILEERAYVWSLGSEIVSTVGRYAAEANWSKRRRRNGKSAKSYGGEVGPAGLFLAPHRRRPPPLPVNAGRASWSNAMNHLLWREKGSLRPLYVSEDTKPRVFKVYGPKDLRDSDKPQSPANSFFENLLLHVWREWSYLRPATLQEAWELALANSWILEYGVLLVGATFWLSPPDLYVPIIRRGGDGKPEIYAAKLSELVGERVIYSAEVMPPPSQSWMVPFIQDDWQTRIDHFSLDPEARYTRSEEVQRTLIASDRRKVLELPWQHAATVENPDACLVYIPGYRGLEDIVKEGRGYSPLSMEDARRDWLASVIEYVTELQSRGNPLGRDKRWTREVVFTGSTVRVDRKLHIPVLTVSGDGMHRIHTRPYEWRFDSAYFLTAGRSKRA